MTCSRRNLTSVIVSVVFLCAAVASAECQQSTNPSSNAASPQAPAPVSGETLWVKGNGLRLKTRIYQSTKLSSHPVLVVVLHGDSPAGPPSYQYAFARKAATQMDNVVVAALLRPGYRDDTGDQSDGERGLTTGDNYTPEIVDAVAQVIDQLKTKFGPAGTVLVGHSGGAAITADVLGRWPDEVHAALLVSCPCDVVAWRKHMMQMQPDPVWLVPIKSLSPIDLASKVPPSVRVRMLVGSEDPVAPPELTQQYASALHTHGTNVTVTIAPGLKHDILLEPIAFEQLKAVVETVK